MDQYLRPSTESGRVPGRGFERKGATPKITNCAYAAPAPEPPATIWMERGQSGTCNLKLLSPLLPWGLSPSAVGVSLDLSDCADGH